MVKIVHEELVELLGGKETEGLNLSSQPTVIMLVGLQGSGKTTMAGKLANMLRKQGKKPLMVACDVYRPAAIDQLEVLGKQLNIPVFSNKESKDVVQIVKDAFKDANSKLNDVIIIDTAGRLHIDEALMDELKNVKEFAKPHEILLVVDSMTGQDAVTVSESFNEQLGINGVILTKLDGDTRGGAALSVKTVTGKPIKFAGTGEKMNDIEVFHPDRMAQRILGMGDVLTLIEKAEEAFDEEETLKLEKKIHKQDFTLQDYLDQLKQVKKMGSLKGLLGMIPGLGSQIKNLNIDEKKFVYIEAIIGSMTKEERNNPDLITKSHTRKTRISKGSGRTYQEINQLTKQFEQMRAQMKTLMSMDEDQMEKVSKGKAPMPGFQPAKPKKGKGKNRGGFRF
jgi:signal recognition particle subunit SRP54